MLCRCAAINELTQDPKHHKAALMHVAATRAEAVVLICLPGYAPSAQMAQRHIVRVDPPTEGVVMERIQTISLDVGLNDLAVHFSGVEETAAKVKHLGASGLLIRARQLAAAPQLRSMRMKVGRWHGADVPVVIKGTRPPMKVNPACISNCFGTSCTRGSGLRV
jgi:hypothetical protein